MIYTLYLVIAMIVGTVAYQLARRAMRRISVNASLGSDS